MAFEEIDEIPNELTAAPLSKPAKRPVMIYALAAGLGFLIVLLFLAY
ncbi:hypothetical protein [Hyphococcus sp.]